MAYDPSVATVRLDFSDGFNYYDAATTVTPTATVNLPVPEIRHLESGVTLKDGQVLTGALDSFVVPNPQAVGWVAGNDSRVRGWTYDLTIKAAAPGQPTALWSATIKPANVVEFITPGMGTLTGGEPAGGSSAASVDRRRSPLTIGFGDSITESTSDPMGSGQGERSYFAQACVLSGQRIVFHRNAGVSGNTVEQMWGRIETDVIAHTPSRVMFMGGTNNMSQADQGSTRAHVRMILDRLHEAGVWVCVVSIPPADGVSAAALDRIDAHNVFLRDEAEARGFLFVDVHSAVVDATTRGWAAGLSADGVHPNNEGAQVMGRFVADTAADHYPVSQRVADQYNTSRNLITNPLLVDAGGDNIPDQWATTGLGNGSLTISAEPGVTGNVLTINRTNPATSSMSISQNLTGLTAGDRFEFAVRFKSTGGATLNVYCAASDAGYVQLSMHKPVKAWTGEYGWSTALMRGTYPAGATRLQVFFHTSDGVGSVSCAQPMVRKIS